MLLIFYIVFSQLAVGGLALLLIIPKDLVGRGFYRLMGLIYLLVMVFARCANLAINGNSISFSNFFLAWEGHDSIFVLIFCGLLLLYTISLWLKQALINRVLLIVGAICGVIWTVYSAQSYGELIDVPASKFLLSAQFLVSATLLGSVNSGMWFGHWYLVTPNLPVIHLKRFNQIFFVSLLLSITFFRAECVPSMAGGRGESVQLFSSSCVLATACPWIWWIGPAIHYHLGLSA